MKPFYRFRLQPYAGVQSRYTCPQCGKKRVFVRYIDTQTNNHIAEDVGRCNREIECGYHKPPREHAGEGYRAAADVRRFVRKPVVARQPSVMEDAVLEASLGNYEHNNLVLYLRERLGNAAANEAVKRYMVGTHGYWPGSTVFWQVDAAGSICAGKVMLYNAGTGKRVKEPYNHISWVHTVLKLEGYELRQCLFGEHLLAGSNKPVAMVESEKTAVIASMLVPEYTWLATGSVSNLDTGRCKVLHGRKLVLYPDAGAYERWEAVSREIPNCSISRVLETEHAPQGYDLADWLL